MARTYKVKTICQDSLDEIIVEKSLTTIEKILNKDCIMKKWDELTLEEKEQALLVHEKKLREDIKDYVPSICRREAMISLFSGPNNCYFFDSKFNIITYAGHIQKC